MSAGMVPPLPLRYRAQYLLLRCWQGASHEKGVLPDLQGKSDMKIFARLTSQKIINKSIKSGLSFRLIFLSGSEHKARPHVLPARSYCLQCNSLPISAFDSASFYSVPHLGTLLKFKTCLNVFLLVCLFQSESRKMHIFIRWPTLKEGLF